MAIHDVCCTMFDSAERATFVQALMVMCYMQEAFATEKAELEDRIKALGEEGQAMLARHALELKQHSRDFEKKMNDFVEKADNVIPMLGHMSFKAVVPLFTVWQGMTSNVPPYRNTRSEVQKLESCRKKCGRK